MEGLFVFIMLMGIALALFFPIDGDWGGFDWEKLKKRCKHTKSRV